MTKLGDMFHIPTSISVDHASRKLLVDQALCSAIVCCSSYYELVGARRCWILLIVGSAEGRAVLAGLARRSRRSRRGSHCQQLHCSQHTWVLDMRRLRQTLEHLAAGGGEEAQQTSTSRDDAAAAAASAEAAEAAEVALIVGGGPGVSAAAAELFCKHGMAVAVAARRPHKSVLAALQAEHAGGVRLFQCDAADPDSVAALFRAVRCKATPQLAFSRACACACASCVVWLECSTVMLPLCVCARACVARAVSFCVVAAELGAAPSLVVHNIDGRSRDIFRKSLVEAAPAAVASTLANGAFSAFLVAQQAGTPMAD
eukprot:COSAG01_NODE_13853_length_1526_cov_7.963560_1_plen_315_part_00